jgi:hypothetical protein
MVDKLVWLNNNDVLHEPLIAANDPDMIDLDRRSPIRKPPPQELAHMTGLHAPRSPLHVYEWVDSQHDEAGPSVVRASKAFKVPKVATGRARQLHSSRAVQKSRVNLGHKQHRVLGKGKGKNVKKLLNKERLKHRQSSGFQTVEEKSPEASSCQKIDLQKIEMNKGQIELEKVRVAVPVASNKKTELASHQQEIHANGIANVHVEQKQEIREHTAYDQGEQDGYEHPEDEVVQPVGPDTQVAVETLEVNRLPSFGFFCIATLLVHRKGTEIVLYCRACAMVHCPENMYQRMQTKRKLGHYSTWKYKKLWVTRKLLSQCHHL